MTVSVRQTSTQASARPNLTSVLLILGECRSDDKSSTPNALTDYAYSGSARCNGSAANRPCTVTIKAKNGKTIATKCGSFEHSHTSATASILLARTFLQVLSRIHLNRADFCIGLFG